MLGQPSLLKSKTDALTPHLIAEVRAEWLDLAVSASEKNTYFLPWFIEASLHLESMKNVRPLRIYAEKALIGLWLFTEDFGYAKLPVFFRRTALHPHQFSGTPLVRRGDEQSFIEGILGWLDASSLKQSFLLLPMMTGEGPLFTAFIDACGEQGRTWYELTRNQRAALNPIKSARRSAVDHIGKSRRRGLKRRREKLSDIGPVRFERLRSRDDIDPWLTDFLRLENQGWKKDKGNAILQNPQDIALYGALVPAAFEHGHLNFSRLVIDDKPIAYAMDLICEDYIYCLKCAHDRAYRKFAPGILLEFELLREYDNLDKDYHIDTCAAPDNAMLNDLYPDRKPYVTLAIARKNAFYARQLQLIKFLKRKMG
ncbi:MAG: GNAT family N-acetyltransferase [Pseudomonadota bacterium]